MKYGLKKSNSIVLSILPAIFLFASGCASRSSEPNPNLVLKGTLTEEVVTLDPSFLDRQKRAEQNFFSSNQDDDDDDSDTAEEQSSEKPDVKKDQVVQQHPSEVGENNSPAVASGFGKLPIIWPLDGTLTSLFGMRTLRHVTRMHSGIDIAAPKGALVLAAYQGQVLFSGKKHGYGYSVVIEHDGGVHETLYAHMSRLAVHAGQYIKRGQVVGYVGRTGRATGPNLHFETRIHGVAYNPLGFLPPSHMGKMLKGMRTPSYADQMKYYGSHDYYAYNNNSVPPHKTKYRRQK